MKDPTDFETQVKRTKPLVENILDQCLQSGLSYDEVTFAIIQAKTQVRHALEALGGTTFKL